MHAHNSLLGCGCNTLFVLGARLQGPSFSLEGNVLSWQKWRVRLGFNYREGLVLNQVRRQPRTAA